MSLDKCIRKINNETIHLRETDISVMYPIMKKCNDCLGVINKKNDCLYFVSTLYISKNLNIIYENKK